VSVTVNIDVLNMRELLYWIQSRGFAIASVTGKSVKDPLLQIQNDGAGLLDNSTERGSKRRTFFGVLWWSNYVRKASSKRWVLDVYGESHLEQAKDFAIELSEVFNVDIKVVLKTYEKKEEVLERDAWLAMG
jgi:hypothetical protein